jgi:hypothetical protein
MNCPHCMTNLLRKQRTGSRCSTCKREFAFDPKTNPLKLHDLRLRALDQRLSGRDPHGRPRLRYTADQLRFAAMRKVLAAGPPSSAWLGCAGVLAVPGIIVTVVLSVMGIGALGALAAVLLVVALAGCLVGHFRTADRRRFRGAVVSHQEFAATLRRWQQVYGEPPRGLLPPGRTGVVGPPGPPRAVLVCADDDLVAFLHAAGLVDRHPVLLVADPAALDGQPSRPVVDAARAGLPVLVLHDADPRGCLAVPLLRAALPGARVIDAGLRPRAAKAAAEPLHVRPPDGLVGRLRAAGTDLDADELSWLADGLAVPVAAVRPVRLLRAVERVVTRETIDDTDRARAIGFLS